MSNYFATKYYDTERVNYLTEIPVSEYHLLYINVVDTFLFIKNNCKLIMKY